MTWGLHDSIAFEKRNVPAVNVITAVFKPVARLRAEVLEMPGHPTVELDHPIASKTEAEMVALAERFAGDIVAKLVAAR